jgi:ribosomal protein S18 acetylase RimI-like enzyme
MREISIERYDDKDFDEVVSLLVCSFKSKFCHHQHLTTEAMKQILASVWDIKADDPAYLHLVAKECGKVVGAILIRCSKSRKSGKQIPFFYLCRRYGFFQMLIFALKLSVLEICPAKHCYIEHIAVDKFMRGTGIGERLLSHAEKALREKGFSDLYLSVAKNNPAKHLYDRKGFKEISLKNSPLKGLIIGISQWYFMKKEITELKQPPEKGFK